MTPKEAPAGVTLPQGVGEIATEWCETVARWSSDRELGGADDQRYLFELFSEGLADEVRAAEARGAQASAAEVERLRAGLVDLTERANPTCGSGAEHAGITRGCGRPLVWSLERVSDPRAAIRCADCLMVFCIGCAKRHFGKSTTVSEEQLEAIREAVDDGCVACEGSEKLYRRITAALARGTR